MINFYNLTLISFCIDLYILKFIYTIYTKTFKAKNFTTICPSSKKNTFCYSILVLEITNL